ncbi:TPA: ead/Ea22-like family protein [Escherichia coli]|uniref:ead/Ea22-like family protein n=1 Tax=Escherichia coli TaxID=562 RepID=UPI001778D494|nr:ead/Ea22-like family protein [Escherichia coli]ELA3354204.1 ead/Ea22-like family protein [Escherichia coli]ELR9598637.1 ead/Ea22-like family protein [Escherichia coli]MDX7196767.1 ead/Ea22-like family protein [Escherichia coli]HAG9033373.1 ead/Ea22-like family protein [Escherichia coli]HBE7839171.1 ead/Ea22-like family protein [Escherichia coli]
MSKIDYQALREAAEKATPGRWEYCHGNTSIEYNVDSMDEDQGSIVYVDSGDFTQKQTDLNGAFIASANPATVLALLDERERNQQYIKNRDQENEDIALTVGKLRVELEAEKQRAKVLFMENARLKSGIAGLIHLGIRYADVDVMKIAGDAQLSTPCTDSIINSIATGIRINGGE